jgi:uncharacterized protein (DUF362 family)
LVNSEVFLLKTLDRKNGIPRLLSHFDLSAYRGKQVALKANYNSADPFPASTHPDTLRAIVEALKEAGAGNVTLAERSGMGDTRRVFEQMGVFGLAEELGFKAVVLEELGKDAWIKFESEGTHWQRGFYLAKLFHDADRIVQTCCLKTHRFGGHFTLSMKNSVGMVAKKVPGDIYDYMWELHESPHQREMIAEINSCYSLDFVVMDGIEVFITDGPEQGAAVDLNLLLASRDRVAIDAVGAALLKLYGAQGKVGEAGVFEQDQIRRAVELGFGARSPDEVVLTALNAEAELDVERVLGVLGAQIIPR